jgi:uncharacterized membrane protein YkvA (DUF1232 family)
MNNSIVKKEQIYTDFYQKVRSKINKWFNSGKLNQKTGKWTDHFLQYLLVFPDLIHLMIKLLADKAVSATYKAYILLVFAYLISPIDIIPDFIPVVGFIDDLLVLVIILNKIINSADDIVLQRIKIHWAGDEDVFDKVKEIICAMNELSSKIPKSIYDFMKKK